MARGVRLSRVVPAAPGGGTADDADVRAWLCLSGGLGVGALLLWFFGSAETWNWQPGLATTQPWRWFTAAWVHLSAGHLGANLAGLVVIGWLGVRARVKRVDTLAWATAWPLTHLALLAQPALQRYAGLSGVLHAAVVVVALRLSRSSVLRERGLGIAVLVGLAIKLLLEEPWQGALRRTPQWDFAVAPAAHLAGALSGALCALLLAHRPGPAVR